MRSARPGTGDYAPSYGRYVALVPDGDIVETLARQGAESRALLAAGAGGLESHRYAPGKWTLLESLAHVVDSERVFTERLLWFARGTGATLLPMDHEAWNDHANAHARPLESHLAEWEAVRAGLLALLEGLAPEAWDGAGEVGGSRITARAMAWMIAGHELNHRALWTDAYGVPAGGDAP